MVIRGLEKAVGSRWLESTAMGGNGSQPVWDMGWTRHVVVCRSDFALTRGEPRKVLGILFYNHIVGMKADESPSNVIIDSSMGSKPFFSCV